MERLPNIHPGVVLREEFLKPSGLSLYKLARLIGVSPKVLTEVLNGRGPITAGLALRLEAYFGTAAQFWMGLQVDHDLEEVRKDERKRRELELLPRHVVSSPGGPKPA